LAVTCALALGLASGQIAKRTRASKGPRAIGLLELFPNGKAWLRPVAIMIDGRFYDANVYKATPVPMAIDGDIVYEATRNGESKGLFTVSGTLQTGKTWVAEGHWRTSESLKPKPAPPKKVEVADDRPVLRRPHADRDKPAAPAPKAPEPAAKPEEKKPEETKPAVTVTREPDDPNRPILRRGKPTGPSESSAGVAYPEPTTPRDLYPAFSDEGGAEPRPYTYSLKPEEEKSYRDRLLAMATDALQPKVAAQKGKPAPKQPAPDFRDVKFHVYDLALSNEPVMVLEAGVPAALVPKHVIVVAGINTYGELHKILAEVTDEQHLDITPRLELIDAVDADGDGVGELLFRKITDSGSGYLIARPTADRVWPMFDTFAVR
jgi:hypothetical protein